MAKLCVALCVSAWVNSTAESFRRRGRRRTKIMTRNPGACAQATAVELQHSVLPQTRSRQPRPSGKSPPAPRSVRSLPSPDRYVNPCPQRSPAAAICVLGRHLRDEPSAGNSRPASIVRGRAVKVGDGDETCRSLLRVGGQPPTHSGRPVAGKADISSTLRSLQRALQEGLCKPRPCLFDRVGKHEHEHAACLRHQTRTDHSPLDTERTARRRTVRCASDPRP